MSRYRGPTDDRSLYWTTSRESYIEISVSDRGLGIYFLIGIVPIKPRLPLKDSLQYVQSSLQIMDLSDYSVQKYGPKYPNFRYDLLRFPFIKILFT